MKIFRTTVLASLLLTHLPAHATSFDCNKGRSITEQLICHRADLSKLRLQSPGVPRRQRQQMGLAGSELQR
jgi:uncharacterized protein